VGTENDLEGVERTGAPRSINRHKWNEPILTSLLNDPDSRQGKVMNGLLALLRIRRSQPAFHPDVPQHIHDLGPAVFAVERKCSEQTLLALNNVTSRPQSLPLPEGEWHDLISPSKPAGTIELPAYGIAWLVR